MLRIQNLSDSNKKLLLSSLPIFSKELDLFVIKFYSYFLKTGAGKLFHSTQLDKQYKMFHTSLGVIISHIEHPDFLEKHLESIIASHFQYGVTKEYTSYFIESFMKALSDILDQEIDTYYNLWLIVITDIMDFFQQNLANQS